MKKGIEAASMDEITKAAGYNKTALFVYFQNKEEIMKKLYDLSICGIRTAGNNKGEVSVTLPRNGELSRGVPVLFQNNIRKNKYRFRKSGPFIRVKIKF